MTIPYIRQDAGLEDVAVDVNEAEHCNDLCVVVFRPEHAHRREARNPTSAITVESAHEKYRSAHHVLNPSNSNINPCDPRQRECDGLPEDGIELIISTRALRSREVANAVRTDALGLAPPSDEPWAHSNCRSSLVSVSVTNNRKSTSSSVRGVCPACSARRLRCEKVPDQPQAPVRERSAQDGPAVPGRIRTSRLPCSCARVSTTGPRGGSNPTCEGHHRSLTRRPLRAVGAVGATDRF